MLKDVASVLATETTQSPDCTAPWLVAYVDDPKTIDQGVRTPADYAVKNNDAIMNRRRTGGSQSTPYGMAAVVATETTQSPDCTAPWFVASVDDPSASGDFTIHGNLAGNRLANYIPRIAGG